MARSLAARLTEAADSTTVSAFPDGSVDHLYTVYDGTERIRQREAFARSAAAGSSAFTLGSRAVEPGGHAVNMAEQAACLGEDVTCVGHLDDPVFADVSFGTASMGKPARVAVHQFEDGDVLTVEPSADIEAWSLADLRALDPPVASVLSADVVFCSNWTMFDALPSVLADLATADLSGDTFLFDPGSVAGRSADEIRDLADALAAVDRSIDVVLAASGEEVRSMAAVLGDGDTDADGYGEALARIRSGSGIGAAVVHETDAAVAVTAEGRERVENFDVEAVRHTGGGDRFDAGLGFALARGWSWRDALLLGNACASRYVATGESAGRSELAAFLRAHERE